MNILVSTNESKPTAYNVAIINDSREQYEEDLVDEKVLFHELMFNKEDGDRDTGENIIIAIARSAGIDDENPGSALERFAKQMFLLGVEHGTKSERERIISRLTDDPDA